MKVRITSNFSGRSVIVDAEFIEDNERSVRAAINHPDGDVRMTFWFPKEKGHRLSGVYYDYELLDEVTS